jgi:hypothetical protein
MTKEQFIQKNGAIRILENQNRYFSRLTHPAKIGNKWEKGPCKGEKLFGGNFYNIGYFRASTNPLDSDLNWESLDYAMSIVNVAADILNRNNCRTLQSEGDGKFFPFIWSGKLEMNDLPDDQDLGVLASKEVGLAYKNNEIESDYSNLPIFYDLNEQSNIFWDDDFEAEITEGMPPETKKAFLDVNALFKKELPVISMIQYYPDYIEFPVVIGGKDRFGQFIGLITSLVWT